MTPWEVLRSYWGVPGDSLGFLRESLGSTEEARGRSPPSPTRAPLLPAPSPLSAGLNGAGAGCVCARVSYGVVAHNDVRFRHNRAVDSIEGVATQEAGRECGVRCTAFPCVYVRVCARTRSHTQISGEKKTYVDRG